MPQILGKLAHCLKGWSHFLGFFTKFSGFHILYAQAQFESEGAQRQYCGMGSECEGRKETLEGQKQPVFHLRGRQAVPPATHHEVGGHAESACLR